MHGVNHQHLEPIPRGRNAVMLLATIRISCSGIREDFQFTLMAGYFGRIEEEFVWGVWKYRDANIKAHHDYATVEVKTAQCLINFFADRRERRRSSCRHGNLC